MNFSLKTDILKLYTRDVDTNKVITHDLYRSQDLRFSGPTLGVKMDNLRLS